MGVYCNLSLVAVLVSVRYLVKPAFWSVNLGLVVLDAVPAAIALLIAVQDGGLWHARSEEFMQSGMFQTLTWLRAVGGVMFFVGGVIPLAWPVISRTKDLRPPDGADAAHA